MNTTMELFEDCNSTWTNFEPFVLDETTCPEIAPAEPSPESVESFVSNILTNIIAMAVPEDPPQNPNEAKSLISFDSPLASRTRENGLAPNPAETTFVGAGAKSMISFDSPIVARPDPAGGPFAAPDRVAFDGFFNSPKCRPDEVYTEHLLNDDVLTASEVIKMAKELNIDTTEGPKYNPNDSDSASDRANSDTLKPPSESDYPNDEDDNISLISFTTLKEMTEYELSDLFPKYMKQSDLKLEILEKKKLAYRLLRRIHHDQGIYLIERKLMKKILIDYEAKFRKMQGLPPNFDMETLHKEISPMCDMLQNLITENENHKSQIEKLTVELETERASAEYKASMFI